MAWTATKTGVARNSGTGEWRVSVEYNNGEGIAFSELYIINSEEHLRQTVLNKVATLKALDALNVAIGPVDLTPNAVTPPPAPTQAELDRAQWLKDYALWIKVKHTLIDTGILAGNETPVITLKTKVQDNFKAGYINFL